MTVQKADDKARKRMEHLRKRRVALAEAMQKNVRQLRKIIHGQENKR